MPKSVKAKLEAKLKEKNGKRRFRGWKGNLVAQTEEFSINVPIRYQKITSQTIDQAMNIIKKSRSLGVTVERKLLGDYHYGYVINDESKALEVLKVSLATEMLNMSLATEIDESNLKETLALYPEIAKEYLEVPKEDVAYYQVIDGKEREVEQFPKTKDFEVTNFISKQKLWNYLLENFYEIWSEKNGLWLLAEYLHKNKKLAVCSHVVLRKSFKEYYGLIFPVVLEDKYTLVMVLTRMNLQYEHLRPAKPIITPQKPTALAPKSVLKVDL